MEASLWPEIGNQPASSVHLVVKVGFLATETSGSFFSENPDVTDPPDP
jgi:hypothetical protein